MGPIKFPGKKKKSLISDLSAIGTDIHSHILPCLDDGAQNINESLELVNALYNLGFSKLIATPHVMSDFYQNTPEMILKKAKELSDAVKRNNIPVQIEAGAEYYIDFEFQDKIIKEQLLTIGNKYLLFELSLTDPPSELFRTLFDLQVSGYKLIIAHPERYMYWHNNMENYIKLKDRNILLQMNINSLSGEYSKPVKKMAEKLIINDMVDLVGTDTHGPDHIELIKTTFSNKYLHKLITSERLMNSKIF